MSDPPRCPECGCNESEPIAKKTRWGLPVEKRQCGFCRHVFPWQTDEGGDGPPITNGVTYHIIRCPECSSEDTVVTRTMRPIRYHRCRGCGANFKSVEASSQSA